MVASQMTLYTKLERKVFTKILVRAKKESYFLNWDALDWQAVCCSTLHFDDLDYRSNMMSP